MLKDHVPARPWLHDRAGATVEKSSRSVYYFDKEESAVIGARAGVRPSVSHAGIVNLRDPGLSIWLARQMHPRMKKRPGCHFTQLKRDAAPRRMACVCIVVIRFTLS